MFRVVEIHSSSSQPRPVREFSSAYRAVDFMTDAWFRKDRRARNLYLVDDDGRVMLSPEDMIGPCTEVWL